MTGSPKRLLLLTLALGQLAACTHTRRRPRPQPLPPCEEAEPLVLAIDGAPNLNPGPDGQPLPTVVRVYELRTSARFERASLEELGRNDRAVLAEDLLEVREVTLLPAGRASVAWRRHPEAGYVAVSALFRRPRALTWRALAQLPASDPLHCHHQPGFIQFFLQEYDASYVAPAWAYAEPTYPAQMESRR